MRWLSDLWKYGFTPQQRARTRGAERYAQAIRAYEKELVALSAAEARTGAERILAAPRFIRVVPPSRTPHPTHPELAPALRAFFHTIQRIEVANGEAYADVAELTPLEWAPGFLRIGPDGEHTHLAVRPHDEAIYVLGDDVPEAERIFTVLATVYHWVLYMERREELLAEPDPPAA
jgi:hypothetical protein